MSTCTEQALLALYPTDLFRRTHIEDTALVSSICNLCAFAVGHSSRPEVLAIVEQVHATRCHREFVVLHRGL